MTQSRFILSAFADEISPEPKEQLDVLEASGVKHIELRSAWKTNVLDLSDIQVAEFKKQLDARGLGISAIGSPIGKISITDPFEPHLERFQRALELCKVFRTPNVRIFSYYFPEGKHCGPEPAKAWAPYRLEVMNRMRHKAELAAKAGVRLLHENEYRIYGEAPELVVDLLKSVNHPGLQAICDPANYVHGGHDAWQGWQLTKAWTVHFHIKDWVHGEPKGRLPGEGHARLLEIMADAVQRGYQGFATLEPHLLGGGPTGGITGPELFPKAVAAFRSILDRVGAVSP
jgi:sugar phosphate isomerase/epimerase